MAPNAYNVLAYGEVISPVEAQVLSANTKQLQCQLHGAARKGLSANHSFGTCLLFGKGNSRAELERNESN